MRSRSGGASTSRWSTAPFTFGARSARISRQRSAYASRAPSGQPDSSYGPYAEAHWPEGAREAYAGRCLDLLAQYAPNVKEAVVHYEVLAPPDLERIFGLVGGSIFQGEQGLDQMAFMRPIPALAQYATPVDGLYLCGAGTHPGGGVMALGGHNAANRVLHDQRWKRRRTRVREALPV